MSRLSQWIRSPFRPPFYGLAALVWGFFVCCHLFSSQTPIFRSELGDTDNYMYLTQTLNWLKGQSWFDTMEYRLNPPLGTPMHFTRILEVPIAGLILLFKQIGLTWTDAAIVAAGLWPLAALAALLAALAWLAQEYVGKDWARFTAFVALFAEPLLRKFEPGQVDHHNVLAVLIVVACACVARMMSEPERLKWPALGALACSTASAIGLEVLPQVLTLSGMVALWMAGVGRSANRSGTVFGATLYLTFFIFLVALKPVRLWFVPELSLFSIDYVLLAGGVALACAAVAMANQIARPVLRRWALGALALAAVAAALALMPQFRQGPYSDVDPKLLEKWMSHIMEAIPLSQMPISIALASAAFPTLGFLAACFFLWRFRQRAFWRWAMLVAMLGASLGLAVFYQVKFARYAALFAVVPLAAMFRHGLSAIGARWRGRKLAALELGLLLLVGPLPGVLLPAVVEDRPIASGVLMFPVTAGTNPCAPYGLFQLLNLPQAYGNRPRVIMNVSDIGSQLLFFTGHNVIAANYHTDAQGTLDAIRFFQAPTDEEAKKIAIARKVDLVIACKGVSTTLKGEHESSETLVDQTGKVELSKGAGLAERLADGKIPPWLKSAHFPMLKDALLFEVVKEPADEKAPPAKR